MRGSLAPLASKNGWTLAKAAGDATPDGMQRLLNVAVWECDGVRDDVRAYIRRRRRHRQVIVDHHHLRPRPAPRPRSASAYCSRVGSECSTTCCRLDCRVLRFRDHTLTVAELLTEHTPGYTPAAVRRPVLTQVYWHQHAVLGWDADEKLLAAAAPRPSTWRPAAAASPATSASRSATAR